jgi:hypothetical protein
MHKGAFVSYVNINNIQKNHRDFVQPAQKSMHSPFSSRFLKESDGFQPSFSKTHLLLISEFLPRVPKGNCMCFIETFFTIYVHHNGHKSIYRDHLFESDVDWYLECLRTYQTAHTFETLIDKRNEQVCFPSLQISISPPSSALATFLQTEAGVFSFPSFQYPSGPKILWKLATFRTFYNFAGKRNTTSH